MVEDEVTGREEIAGGESVVGESLLADAVAAEPREQKPEDNLASEFEVKVAKAIRYAAGVSFPQGQIIIVSSEQNEVVKQLSAEGKSSDQPLGVILEQSAFSRGSWSIFADLARARHEELEREARVVPSQEQTEAELKEFFKE